MAANVLLDISTKTDFASLESLKNMVMQTVGAIGDWMATNERFVQQMNNATVSLSEFDKNVANLVDTGLAFQKSTELTNAGLDVTAEQYAAIAKAATVVGKATGDVNGAFQRLTRALQTGRTTALKEYGVELERTGDRQADFEDAVEQLTQKFNNQQVEIDTTGEALDALGNNWGTIQGQILDAAGGMDLMRDTIIALNDSFSAFSAALAEGTVTRFVNNMTDALGDWTAAADHMLVSVSALGAGINSLMSGDGFMDAFQREMLRSRAMMNAVVSEMDFRENNVPDQGPPVSGMGPAAPRTRRPTRSRATAPREMEFTPQDVEQFEAQQEQDLIDSFGRSSRMAEFGTPDQTVSPEQDIAYRRELLDIQIEQAALADATGQSERVLMQDKLALLQEQAALKAAELEVLGYDPESPEYRQAQLDLAQIEHEQFLIQKETEIETASRWSQAWQSALSTYQFETFAAQQVTDSLTSAVRSGLYAAFESNKSVVKAIGETLKAKGRSMAIEASIQALMELAKGVAAQATTWGYPNQKAVLHYQAAGQYGATAAAAAGLSGAGAAIANAAGSGGGGSRRTTPDRSGGNVPQAPEPRNQTTRVELVLEGDEDQLMESLLKVNGRRARAGETHMAEGEA